MNSKIKDFLIVLGKQNKIKFLILIFFSFIGSILDILSLGSIPVLIITILDPIKLKDFLSIDYLILLNDYKKLDFVILVSIAVGTIFLVKNFFIVILIYFESMFIKNICVSNGSSIFNKYLSLDVSILTSYAQSNIIRNLTSDNFQAAEMIRSLLHLIRELLIISSIAAILVYSDPAMSLIIFISLGFFSFMFFFFIKKNLKNKGIQAQIHKSKQIKCISETYDFIKEIKVLNRENYSLNNFKKELNCQIVNNEYFNFVSKLPRIFLETLSIVGITISCVFYVNLGRDVTDLIPILSLLTISLVRLMPSFNLITSTFSLMSYYLPSIQVISKELQKIDYEDKDKYISEDLDCLIKLKNISFRYPKKKNILNDISLDIKDGENILIRGRTGSGKSTLLGVLIGFLNISTGKKLYSKKLGNDYKTFLSYVGFVPQEIYLIDDTIKKNITFGVDDNEIDIKRVKEVIDICQLRDEISNFTNGVETLVGNRGILLSGGQKQRIAIARALYRDPKILFFDEISSSLDLETERKLILEICNKLKDKTIILVSHSLQFKTFADKIIDLDKNNIYKNYNV
jgi:ABC-type multidrug transport system fused ATPase/permease subunit